ncbi:hypothetical protein Hypma_007665 [Hypsizygus marmoreus]|uniref:Mmc1 C-terminal domain-containing protein n=1 Tax=Hypsizygus marmoreus TaxID=39966 RepID=A0A369K0A7_HYPMA|nr:hypothetical protein Hypma_007665 [Hypsizygus marmoreus]
MLVCRVCSLSNWLHRGLHSISRSCKGSLCRATGQTGVPRHEILTLLHKTTALLPHALASRAQGKTTTESLEFWNNILSATFTDSSSISDRPVKVAVYGVDEWAEAQDLITALLEEPLTSDESENQRIRSRWNGTSEQGTLTISYGSFSNSRSSNFQTQSSYLRQFPISLEITEVRPTISSQSLETFVLDNATSATLLAADIAIVVCNPVTTPLPALLRNPSITLNPNTILVVTSTATCPTTDAFMTSLSRLVPATNACNIPKVIFVDPLRAMAANNALKGDSRSSIAIQRYQDNFVGSHISTVTDTLKAILSSGSDVTLRVQISLAHIRAALSACQASLKRARREMDVVSVSVSHLTSRIEEAKARVQGEVLGQPAASRGDTEGDVVVGAVAKAAKDVRMVMDRLTWWKMVWRVDEISLIVSQAVHQAWCQDLERQLILQTGRLSALQDDVTKSIFTILKTHSTPPYNSEVLRNSICQITASPSFPVTPKTLTGPIETRRAQIIEHPTTRLHLAGQRIVLGMGGGIAAGAGMSWAGWFGWLAGSGEGLFGAVGLDAGTAMGVGLLGAVAGMRWAAGKWERSKMRWWEDWNRVGEGLGRDLRTTLDQTMRENVLVAAEHGCTRLSELVVRRKGEIEEIEQELDKLTQTLQALEEHSQ